MTDTKKDNPIWQHHMQNLKNGTSVKNEDGSFSTVRTIIMGDGQSEYLIPTVWDGQILSDEDAWDRAMSSGIAWPKAPSTEEGIRALENYDKVTHEGMTTSNYVDEQMKNLQGFAEGAIVDGPWTPERADESGRVDKPKEDEFGDTIASMSARSFRDAWDIAVNAGKIQVNADDPRILTAFKQSNQYITDMATAGALTLQGATEAAAGAIGEVFGGDSGNEEMLATDIMGMFESAEGLGPASMVGKTENAVETTTEALKDIKLRANQPSALEADTLGSNLGNVGQAASSATETKLRRHLEGTPTPAEKSYLIPEEDISKMELLSDTPVKNLFEKGEGTHGVLESSNLGNVPLRDIKTLQEDLTYLRYDVQQLYLDKFKQDHNISFPNGVPSGFKSEDEAIRWFTDRVDLTPKANEFNNFLNRNRIIVNSDYRKELELPNSFSFRDPVMEFAQEVQIPSNGIKGSEFLKVLDKTPHARSALYNTVDLGIDKAKTYTREELLKTIEPNTWVGKFEVQKRPAYRGVQTQELAGFEPEGDYSEIFYRIGRKDRDLPTFKIPDQYPQYHFPEDVAAHARISLNENYATKEKEIIVHELQSDFLQKGAKKPTKPVDIEAFKKNTLDYALTALPEDMRSPENVAAIRSVIDNEDTLRRGYVASQDADHLNKVLRESGVDFDSRNAVSYYIDEQLYGLDRGAGNTKLPLGNVKDSVENLVDGLLAHAQTSGVDKIYIPSIEQLVAADRLKPGSLSFFESVRPGSFFYDTYVKGLTETLDDLTKSTGTSVTRVDRPNVKVITYKDLPDDIAESFIADMRVAKSYKEMTSGKITKEQFQKTTGLDDAGMSDFFRKYDTEFRKASKEADKDWLKTFKESAYKDAVKVYGVDKQIDSVGTLIDIGESKNTYDFTKIKMAKGGLVRTFATGGLAEDEQMNKIMQEGGMADDGMTHEPATGNEIPPGSLASEVRDDIDVKLSEGEYVVPADVLRYYGVRFFEDLRAQAKQGMAEMDSQGRIGGTPVTEEGVPVENTEEALTPEEEQMLMEALGAGDTGMAEGGAVFDRTKFSSSNYNQPSLPVVENGGLTTRKYINPQTKEVRELNFIGTTPVGAVPEGFVPWTQELADMPTATPQSPVSVPSITQNNRPEGAGAKAPSTPSTTAGAGDKEAGGGAYAGWAEKNYEAISKDPYSFGMNALAGVDKTPSSTLGKIADRLTGGGGVFGDVGTMGAISDAQAALSRVTDAKQREALQAAIDKASASINSPLLGITTDAGLTATGKNKAKAISWFESLTKPKTTTTPAKTSAPAKSDLGASSTSRGVSYTSDANSKGEFSQRVATGSTAPTTSPRPQSRPASLAGGVKSGSAGGSSRGSTGSSGGSSSAGSRTESRRAKGGLVAKEQPKTKKSDKGLASKTKS